MSWGYDFLVEWTVIPFNFISMYTTQGIIENEILTPEYILSKCSDLEIYERVLGFPVQLNKRISSPLRQDKNPSFCFFSKQGKVLWKDFGSGEAGDVFKLIMRYQQVSFTEALQLAAKRLNIKARQSFDKLSYCETPVKKEKIITMEFKPFNSQDLNFWNQYGISMDTLEKYHVQPAKHVFIDGEFLCSYTPSNPIYSYWLGNGYYKIYRPYEKMYKWLTNCPNTIMQGFDELPWLGNLVIVGKALKDTMSLYEMGYNSTSLQGESCLLSIGNYENLKERFTRIVMFLDNDETGVVYTNKNKAMYPIESILIPEETGCKDISDYVKMYGMEKGKRLMNDLLCN